jgi:hypothetical protein
MMDWTDWAEKVQHNQHLSGAWSVMQYRAVGGAISGE